jgi:5-formyltetrahydrofolate cyclo-ligase
MINKLSKYSIRKQLLISRRKLSPEFILENSKKIAESLIKFDVYRKSTNIMLYIATKHEVQTQSIIKSAQKDKKRVFIPLIIRRDNKLLPSLVNDFERELAVGDLGILQPKREFFRIYPPNVLDLVIVPGVAFTIQGHRLGRGGGYYDQFLTQLKPKASSVALAFEMQILAKIPVEEKDIPVDYIITEAKVIRIRK